MNMPLPLSRPLALAIAAALCSPLALAETSASTSAANDAEPQRLDTVRVIGQANDPQTSTGSAYVLSAAELDKFDASNANNVLATVPGVYTREESGMGQFPRIGIRASSAGRSNRVAILEDGIPAAMAAYANTSAYFFPNIGRMHTVEVLKGPETLLYGPQTTSGVINFVSTPIPQTQAGQLKAEAGAFGTRKLHAYYGGTHGQFGWLLEHYNASSDGFHRIDRSNNGSGYAIEDSVAKLRWQSADDAAIRQQLDIKLGYDVETLDVSYVGLTDADFAANPNRRYGLSALERMDRGRRSASAQHQLWFSDDTRLTSTAYWAHTYRYYKRVNQINGIGLGGVTERINTGAADATLLQGILDGSTNTTHANGIRYGHNHQDFQSKGVQLQLDHRFATGNVQHELIAGARWHQDTTNNAVKRLGNAVYAQINGALVLQSQGTATPSQGDAKAVDVWLADRISIGAWQLLPVLRHERIRTRANLAENPTPAQLAARNSNSLSKTTFGFGANYAINAHWTLLGGVHQGFAGPGNGVAQGTRGEESINYEGGLRWRSGAWGVDAIAFLSDYRNALRTCLVANPCPDGRVDGTEHTGQKKVHGLELGAFGLLHDDGQLRVPVRAAWTFTGGEYTRASDTGSVLKGDVLDYTPKTVGTLQVGLETAGGWNSYAQLNWQDKAWISPSAKRSATDNRYMQTQSLLTMDLTTHYPLTRNVQAYARIDNVFNQQRITHRGADGARGNAPRAYSVGMKVAF